jgi:hypothetical protein
MKESERRYRPGFADPKVDDRKQRFAKLNAFVTAGGGWIISILGAIGVLVEVLPGSSLPDELRQLGYQLEPDSEGQRILPAAIVENFARRADGALAPITAGATRAIAETRTHAGLVKVERFAFRIG